MKKNIIKIVALLFIVAIITFLFTNSAFALETKLNLDPTDKDITGVQDKSGAGVSIAVMIGILLNVIQVIAVGVAVIMLAVLAIKYMSAAPNDKAEIKKHAVVYVVGAVVLFGASGILQIIKQFAGTIDKEGGVAETTTTTTDTPAKTE